MKKIIKRLSRDLRGGKVHLVTGFTGGGQEYCVGIFASLKDARKAVKNTIRQGRNAYVSTRKIR
jgi:hypothetical protein